MRFSCTDGTASSPRSCSVTLSLHRNSLPFRHQRPQRLGRVLIGQRGKRRQMELIAGRVPLDIVIERNSIPDFAF